MNIDDLVKRIKRDGYDVPKIAIMTPEIRTIDVTVETGIPVDRFEFLEEEEE